MVPVQLQGLGDARRAHELRVDRRARERGRRRAAAAERPDGEAREAVGAEQHVQVPPPRRHRVPVRRHARLRRAQARAEHASRRGGPRREGRDHGGRPAPALRRPAVDDAAEPPRRAHRGHAGRGPPGRRGPGLERQPHRRHRRRPPGGHRQELDLLPGVRRPLLPGHLPVELLPLPHRRARPVQPAHRDVDLDVQAGGPRDDRRPGRRRPRHHRAARDGRPVADRGPVAVLATDDLPGSLGRAGRRPRNDPAVAALPARSGPAGGSAAGSTRSATWTTRRCRASSGWTTSCRVRRRRRGSRGARAPPARGSGRRCGVPARPTALALFGGS